MLSRSAPWRDSAAAQSARRGSDWEELPGRTEHDISVRVLLAPLQEELHALLDCSSGAVAQAAYGAPVLAPAAVAGGLDRLAEGEVEALGPWQRGSRESSGQRPEKLGAATEPLERRPHRRKES